MKLTVSPYLQKINQKPEVRPALQSAHMTHIVIWTRAIWLVPLREEGM